MSKSSNEESSPPRYAPYDWHGFAMIDTGANSDAYPDPADRQAVSDLYTRGNAAAAKKREVPFDNRIGFIDTTLKH